VLATPKVAGMMHMQVCQPPKGSTDEASGLTSPYDVLPMFIEAA